MLACAAAALLGCGAGSSALPALPAGLDSEVDAALHAARGAVEDAPADARAWGRLGMTAEVHGLAELAVASYGEAERFEGQASRWPFRRGVCLARLGRVEEALAAMRLAAERDPAFVAAHREAGRWSLELGDVAGARAACRRALELAPRDYDALVELARAELAADEPAAAVAALERALAVRPDDRFAQLLLGAALRECGRGEEAAAALARGAGGRRVSADPHADELEQHRSPRDRALTRIRALSAAGRHSDAIPILEQLLRDEPESLFALQRLAIAYGAVGRAPEGAALLERALELEPRNVRTHVNLASLLLPAGDARGAERHAREAIALDPAQALAHELLGNALRAQGRMAEALDSYLESVAWDPRTARAWFLAAGIQMDLQDWPAAGHSLERAVALDDRAGDVHACLAITRLRVGRATDALAAYELARERCAAGDRALAMARRELTRAGLLEPGEEPR